MKQAFTLLLLLALSSAARADTWEALGPAGITDQHYYDPASLQIAGDSVSFRSRTVFLVPPTLDGLPAVAVVSEQQLDCASLTTSHLATHYEMASGATLHLLPESAPVPAEDHYARRLCPLVWQQQEEARILAATPAGAPTTDAPAAGEDAGAGGQTPADPLEQLY